MPEERAIQSESGRLKRTAYAPYVSAACSPVQKRVKPPMEMNLPGPKPIRFSILYVLRSLDTNFLPSLE